MKKVTLTTVLFLFLLVPASITRAQKVSVSGNVYEKGTVKNSFQTPHGIITTVLPDDIRPGEVISGSVLHQPSGHNEKEKKKNLDRLLKYAVYWSPKDHPPLPYDWISSFRVPDTDAANTLRIFLKDPDNNIVAESNIPFDITVPDASGYTVRGRFWEDTSNKQTQPQEPARIYVPDKKIYTGGEQAQLFSSGASNEKLSGKMIFLNHSKTGDEQIYQQIELKPLAGSPRKTVITIPDNIYGPAELVVQDENRKIIAREKIHVLQLEAFCPKTNLMKGESTVLKVKVMGLEGCPADYLRLTLNNTTSRSVQLGQSNHEELIIEPVMMKYSAISRDYKKQEKFIAFEIKDWSFSEALDKELSLQRPITALQTGNFNIDITLSYPSTVYNDPSSQQLEAIKTHEQLKNWIDALNSDLTNLLNVKKGDGGLGEFIGDQITARVNLDQAKSRVYNYVRRLDIPTQNDKIPLTPRIYINSGVSAGHAAVQNAIREAGTMPINYEVIHSALQSASEYAGTTHNNYWKEIIDSLRSRLLKIQREAEEFSRTLRTLEEIEKALEGVKKWITQNMRASVDLEGDMDFVNAQIQEISFPKMNAGNKDGPMISIHFNPKEVQVLKKNQSTPSKQWTPANFKIHLDDLPCQGITKVDGFKLSVKHISIMTDVINPVDYLFDVAAADIKPWQDWLNNRSEKTGKIEYLDASGNSQISLDLSKVIPVSMSPVSNGGARFRVTAAAAYVNYGQEMLSSLVSAVDPGRVLRPDDLVAVFNPGNKKLVFAPAYQKEVFERIKPHLRADGKYDVTMLSMNRKPISMIIDIVPGTQTDLINQSEDSIKYDEYGFESTGEMIKEHWDSTGAGYRFYKNAKCKRWKEGGETACSAFIIQDSSGEYVESGKYYKLVYSPLGHCYEGTEFCTEMYVIDMIAYLYDDVNCKRLISVKTYHGWSCE